MSPAIRVAAALILDDDGRMLLVRKRGTDRFMQAGGKIEPGEDPASALVRELGEELLVEGAGLAVPVAALTSLGRFTADAANEPGHTVESEVFRLDLTAVLPSGVAAAEILRPAAELEELVWFDPTGPARGDLAPLTERFVVPLAVRAVQQGMATSFGRAADDYDRARPEYPAEAVAWMVPDGARVVVDVGAGTGKLTAVVARTATAVIAVDPDPGMLAVLARALPGIETRIGTGERIPVKDASVDAVTFGQAWHWVDVPAASREAARVLRPGGRLGLIWNIRDETVPWVAELGRAMQGSAAEQLIADGGPQVGPPFDELETLTWEWERTLTVDELVALAASRSYVITASAQRRDQVRADVRALGAAQAHDGLIVLPYVTHAFRGTAGPTRGRCVAVAATWRAG